MNANYIIAADVAGDSFSQNLRREDGRLFHTWRNGQAKLDAYLDDYASLANALVTLYEATCNERWIDEAVRLMDIVLDKFSDPAGGGFFYTATDHEQLLTRTKELTDSSTPSGNALAATRCCASASCWAAPTILMRPKQRSRLPRHFGARPDGRRADAACSRSALRPSLRTGARWRRRKLQKCKPLSPRFGVATYRAQFSLLAIETGNKPTRSSHLDELFAGKSSPDGQSRAVCLPELRLPRARSRVGGDR